MKKFNISNSLLVSYLSYQKGNVCPIYFVQNSINKTIKTDQTEPQMLGNWFEFITTGALNRDGSEPQPIRNKPKKKDELGQLNAKSKILLSQKDNFDNIYQNIIIEETQKEIIYQDLNFKIKTKDGYLTPVFKGIFDVLARFDNSEDFHIRDIKTSGLLSNDYQNKNDESGWACLFGNNYNPEKKHLNQAKFYIWLWYKLTGEIVDFYFDVFSSSNEYDCKIIKVFFENENALLNFENFLYDLVNDLYKKLENNSFTMIPDYERFKFCQKCSFKECDERLLKPVAEPYEIREES